MSQKFVENLRKVGRSPRLAVGGPPHFTTSSLNFRDRTRRGSVIRVRELSRDQRERNTSEGSQLRHKCLQKLFAMTNPPSGVWEIKERPLPARAVDCALHICLDRPHQSRDRPRLKPLDSPAERRLAGETRRTPRRRIQSIDGLRARIDEVATGVLKHCEEALVGYGGIDRAKRIPHGPIQPRVLLVEEPS